MDALDLGRYLRDTRLAKERTLDDAVEALRIRRHILEAFEAGEFTSTGSSAVQVRGFLRNYAQWLGLDPNLIINYYEVAVHSAQTHPARGKRKTQTVELPAAPHSVTDTQPNLPIVTLPDNRPSPLVRFLQTFALIAVSLAALAIIVFVTIQVLNIEGDSGTVENIPSFIDLPPTATRTPRPTFTPFPTSTPELIAFSPYTGQGVLVNIQFTQRCWIRIKVDGIERFSGIALPDQTILEYQGNEIIEVSASNAEALRVVYNGVPQEVVFGGRGQLVDITFTPQRMDFTSGPGFEPTPIASPTPLPRSESIAPTLLAQLTPSATPGPSPTPSNTPTPSDTPTVTPTPTITPTPSDTPTATLTPSITPTPSNTPTPSDTPTITPTPTATAILPPREPLYTPTPSKSAPLIGD